MQLSINRLVPVPLKDVFSGRPSDVWNKELAFGSSQWTKIKAPSGTGKTTLIHFLYKLRSDYEGRITVNSKDLKSIQGDELALLRQNRMSVIFQDLRLFPNLTARENIELNRVLQEPYYPAEKINAMAGELGITHILEQKTGLCSYGEQQRIAIARALVQPFEFLLMDEPFSHLDMANTARAAALIAGECKARNAGFILTDLDDDNNFDYTEYLNL